MPRKPEIRTGSLEDVHRLLNDIKHQDFKERQQKILTTYIKDKKDVLAEGGVVQGSRVVASYSIAGSTLVKLDELSKLCGQNKGRVIDLLVAHMYGISTGEKPPIEPVK